MLFPEEKWTKESLLSFGHFDEGNPPQAGVPEMLLLEDNPPQAGVPENHDSCKLKGPRASYAAWRYPGGLPHCHSTELQNIGVPMHEKMTTYMPVGTRYRNPFTLE